MTEREGNDPHRRVDTLDKGDPNPAFGDDGLNYVVG